MHVDIDLDDGIPDPAFWERLAEMPYVEAIEELRDWRVHLTAQLPRLQGVDTAATLATQAALTRIRLEIARISDIQTRINWRAAVRAVCGEEAYEQCCVWIVQQDPRA